MQWAFGRLSAGSGLSLAQWDPRGGVWALSLQSPVAVWPLADPFGLAWSVRGSGQNKGSKQKKPDYAPEAVPANPLTGSILPCALWRGLRWLCGAVGLAKTAASRIENA